MKTNVKQSKKKLNKVGVFFGFFLLLFIILITLDPKKYSLVAYNGLEIWVKILVPSLLPFFILTKLFYSTGMVDNITTLFNPITKKIYKCPKQSFYVFLMSILSGYPVGSKLIADLYNNGQINKTDAIKTASFCSNSGPMFILGSVAIGMFNKRSMGFIILISHIIGALLNGIIYRNIGKKENQNNYQQIPNAKFNFSDCINSSIQSILLIGGVICFTFVMFEVIITSSVFKFVINLICKIGIDSKFLSSIFIGLGEITKGCLLLASTPLTYKTATIACTFIIGFGGISTYLQAMAFLKDIVPAKIFLLQKFTHALVSTIVCVLLLLIF